MAKDNDQFARQKELAREYEKKMAARDQRIKNMASQKIGAAQLDPYTQRNFYTLFNLLYIPALSSGKYQKPSEFFLGEMPWIFGLIVYDRFRDAFLHIVDQVPDYPYSVGWGRRSFRSKNYLNYDERISQIVRHFQDAHCIDADICDVLTGNLSEDTYCYLTTRNTRTAGFAQEVLAYELDQENPRLESIVADIINGDSEFSKVSHELIHGIIMSHNPRMHGLLSKLLVAARMQEGLRQVICEGADCGTVGAFHAILSTILEQDLIRYSSVKRAVGTWIGVMTEETRDLDRISNKSIDIICKCLKDAAFREACLASEDSMAIHIALWSYAFENTRNGYEVLDRIIEEGTHHQVLTAGYFVANLENPILRQVAAREVLKSRREHYDILAVYLPSLIPFSNYLASSIAQGKEDLQLELYFETPDQAKEFCDWLMEVHGSMKKKELEFNPCIFPWYAASVKKSDLVEKAMVIAAMIEDQERIDRLCPHISDCDASGRDLYFKLLTKGTKTEPVRKAIIDGLEDKNTDTRRAAFERANGMMLHAEEYRQIEDMLRLRYDDLRRGAMELLMKQPDENLQATVKRLLASSKTQMRTAGLDMVTQLSKSEDRKAVAGKCMEAVRAIAKPTTQEKILIDALMPKQESVPAEPLFTDADRYVPVIEIDDYALESIRAFMEIFPDSKLEKQILAGKQITHDAIKLPALPSASAKTAQKNLKSLSEYIIAHERDTFSAEDSMERPIGVNFIHFFAWKENGEQGIPRMDLWEQWRDENNLSLSDLFAMLILGSAQEEKYPYLTLCSKYIRDLYGNGFDQPLEYRYAEHMHKIVYELIYERIPAEQCQKIVNALGLWIACCLPDEMLLGDSGITLQENAKQKNNEIDFCYLDARQHVHAVLQREYPGIPGHFIAHPQINCVLHKLDISLSPSLRYRIPVMLNVHERTFASTNAHLEKHGQPVKGRVPFVMNQIYQKTNRINHWKLPDESTYLYAHHYGLISEKSLHYHLMAPGFFKNALKLITAVCAMRPAYGDTVSSRTFSMYGGYGIRRSYDDFIGKNAELNEEQLSLVELCRRTAQKLVPIVVNAELQRGDTPTDYSSYVTGIHVLSGMETFVRILSALGKDTLDRSVYYWGNSQEL